MTKTNILKITVTLIFLWMVYVVYTTSVSSNLFKEWDSLALIPWMKATLWDFYANVFFIFLWVCYKEPSWFVKILWLVLLVCLGSIATAAYILIQLFKLQPGEPVENVITSRNKTTL
jgi:hypothetical protein